MDAERTGTHRIFRARRAPPSATRAGGRAEPVNRPSISLVSSCEWACTSTDSLFTAARTICAAGTPAGAGSFRGAWPPILSPHAPAGPGPSSSGWCLTEIGCICGAEGRHALRWGVDAAIVSCSRSGGVRHPISDHHFPHDRRVRGLTSDIGFPR